MAQRRNATIERAGLDVVMAADVQKAVGGVETYSG
jgi:hypothetical protein